MDSSKLKSVFPFLGNVDLDNPKTKRNVILALVGGVLLILLLVLNAVKGGDAPTEQATRPSSTIEAPQGENNDILSSAGSAADVWAGDRRRTDRSLSDIWGDGIDDSDPMAGLKGDGKEDDVFSPTDLNLFGTEQEAEPAQDEPSPFGRDVYPERAPREPRQKAAPAEPSRSAYRDPYGGAKAMTAEERVAARKRQLLLEKGIDPDTGMPLEQGQPSGASSSSGGYSGGGYGSAAVYQESEPEVSEPSVQPEAGEPAQAESKVSVRKSGEVSSLRASRGGAVGGLGSLKTKDQYVSEDSEHLFKVMFANNEKVSSGQRVTLRLLDDMVVDGILVPANTFISAICSIGDRLSITVNSIELNGRIYVLNYEGYDTDGAKGLYCPHTDRQQQKEEVGREGRQLGRSFLGGRMAGMAGQVVTAGATILESSKGVQKVVVTSGYTFFLKKARN